MKQNAFQTTTYCRICEALCGLEATVDENNSVSLKPDKSHPVSAGYACIKGVSFGAMHDSDNRVNFPLKRTDSGFVRISWSQAIEEISARTRAIKNQYGARSLAHYMGNPSFFDASSSLLLGDFAAALGSPNCYSSHSVDLNNKFYGSGLIYGLDELLPIPDLTHTNCLLILGGNPLVSQMSVIGVPDVPGKLQAIEARGGKVFIADPRRTETAAKVGEHLPVAPGQDAFLLLGLLNAIVFDSDLLALNKEIIQTRARNLDALVELASKWPQDRVASLLDLEQKQLEALYKTFIESSVNGGAVVYLSTGVNMSGFGTICYWLAQVINFISGNFDRKGGSIVPEGSFDFLGLMLKRDKQHKAKPRQSTLDAGWKKVAGYFPVGVLPDEILSESEGAIRALFVSAGNPAHSMPHPDWHKALGQLELLVSVDIVVNDTARAHADYILPATDMLEREDFSLSQQTLQLAPFVHYTKAVVTPKYERRPEWQIFSELANHIGIEDIRSPLAVLATVNRFLDKLPGLKWRFSPTTIYRLVMMKSAVSWRALTKTERGATLKAHRYGEFFQTWPENKLFDLTPAALLADLERLVTTSGDRMGMSDSPSVRVIGRRDRRTHNSWMRFNKAIKKPDHNALIINEHDAAELQIKEQDSVLIATDRGSLAFPARLTDSIARGVVSVPHGWGGIDSVARTNERGQSYSAREESGENINNILVASLEPGSGQAVLTGQRVTIARASTEAL